MSNGTVGAIIGKVPTLLALGLFKKSFKVGRRKKRKVKKKKVKRKIKRKRRKR